MNDNKLAEFKEEDLLKLLVDDAFGAIFTSKGIDGKITTIYNDLNSIGISGAETINDILKMVDSKSEITEILGVNEFFDNIAKSFNNKNAKVYLPLKINDKTKVYSFKTIKLDDGVLLNYIQLIDSDTLDIERLYMDSYKDALTFLFNKNALNFHIQKNVEYHYVGFMDLDNFKYVNDTYSHSRGNELLLEIGKKLILTSDDTVIFYRYGGDEFVFITIDLNYEETLALTERIQKAISSIDFEGLKLSFSIGISEYSKESKYDLYDAVKIADFAMYESKYNRNKTVSFINSTIGNLLIEEGNIDHVLEKYKNIRRKKF